MKPILLVSTRPEDVEVEAEYRSFQRTTGLAESELEQVRLDMLGLPDIDVEAYSGIIVGGSPYGTTTSDVHKSATQKRAEAELFHLLQDVTTAHVPCFTTGYGTEVATVLMGGQVTTKWAEPAQITEIYVVAEHADDPILEGVSRTFYTYVNHTEAVEELPEDAVLLAKSLTCPAEVMRFSDNFYATQFNPEIDSDAIRAALERYEDAGYPGTDDVESLMLAGRLGACDHQAGKLVRNFVRLFGA